MFSVSRAEGNQCGASKEQSQAGVHLPEQIQGGWGLALSNQNNVKEKVASGYGCLQSQQLEG